MLKMSVEEIRGRLRRRLELGRDGRVLPGWRRFSRAASLVERSATDIGDALDASETGIISA